MLLRKYRINQPLLTICCMLFTCLLFGQVKQEADINIKYGKEGKLAIKELSSDGKWVSYTMDYESGADTLFLQNTATKSQWSFPGGTQPNFGGSKLFAYKENKNLVLRQLPSGTTVTIPEIKRYSFLKTGLKLVTLNSDNQLQLRNAKGEILERVDGISSYEINEGKDALLYCSANNGNYVVGILDCKNDKKSVLAEGKSVYDKLIWRGDGQAVAYKNEAGLEYFDLSTAKRYKLPSAKFFELGKIISNNSICPMAISDDGKKVFFGLALAEKRKLEKGPEIWNGNDAKLYSVQQTTAASGIPLVSVWFPNKGEFKILSDELRYTARLTGKSDYVLLSDPFSYSVEPAYPELVDYYIKNVNTGAEKLLLRKQSHASTRLCFSPLNNSMVYYREGEWWYYTPETDNTLCLTSKVKTEWINTDKDAPPVTRVYGLAAWTADGRFVYLHDKYDIWKVALDGKSCARITNGRSSLKEFRLDKVETAGLKFKPYSKEQRLVTDEQKDLLFYIENQNDWSTGYGLYSQSKGLRILDYGPQFRSELHKSENSGFVFLRETYDMAPQLNFASASDLKARLLYASNKGHSPNRKAELISCRNSKGTTLKGALFYPDGYDATKQYPMIVKIYEKKSKEIHWYSRPTLLSLEGNELANFTASGYFVLYPDFELELGNPGITATDCTIAAVKAATSKASIDVKRIGLLGHSFGGYETNFIITQTDIFAAAVSGAGISNTIGRYFGLALSLHHTDMFRYESQQWRMGTSFFANKEGYWNNNPISYADKIKTPILLWHGRNDDTIPFDQGISYYLALRRLGLKTILVAYANDGHSVELKENQIDLSQRIIQWFDYFLKGKTDVGWITNGVSSE